MDLFAVAPPGVETLLQRELAALGLEGRAVPGGVELRGDAATIGRVNLESRLASRLLLRLARFETEHLNELEKFTAKLDVAPFIRADEPLSVRASCRKSRIYHSGAAEERVQRALAKKLGAAPAPAQSNLDEDDAPPQTVLVRFDHDVCTLSLDTSGAHLHKRGYRLESGKAPIRETLAAALLAEAGYQGDVAFVDPLCGSGTFAIEAASIATRSAPGRLRNFAFERWPSYDARAMRRLRDEADARRRPAPAPIVASDRDEGAVSIAQRNAERAEVAIEVRHQSLSDSRPPASDGLLLTNPPYGARVGDPGRLRDLYATLGKLANRPFAGWTVGFVTTDERLALASGIAFTRMGPPVPHGGLRVKLYLREPAVP
ncbi:MAG TPA: class I SAM-dependent RNA methyltransferase [Verrucomicrobiae bacterium]|nr:class I SAM-dependent RNA methyltransferase [Verrucomicrobiae bacterium]